MGNYFVEKRESPNDYYLNISLNNENDIIKLQDALSKIDSVYKVNIADNAKKQLIVYRNKAYSIDVVEKDVNDFLEQYTSGNAIDPKIETDLISGDLSDEIYGKIISAISKFGKNMEKTPSTYCASSEEDFRNSFLSHLNSISTSTVATGETYNSKGKTDILIQNTSGENLFIAECKLWSGEQLLKDAINQLLERYVTWRDTQLAIIVFNKTNKSFTELITKAHSVFKLHSKYKRMEQGNDDTNKIFIFKHPIDDNKEVKLALLLFNFFAPVKK
ncbi:hypothetical protein [Bacteroides heparinolyticus]|uniref:hypothetical protein n=2 Tax=Prevotella heparinolytica TaxID=28113 RepID=UPI0028F1729F|nr:hypothetical protein [Bacteroides heparinolyticus]